MAEDRKDKMAAKTRQVLQETAFEPNAILRGAQLTFVGANRALQNPRLFTSEHYKQAALAVLAGIAIRILVAIPTLGIRLFINFTGLFVDLSQSTWDEEVIEGIHYIEHHVLQLPFFLMSFMRFLSPAMDHMFMDSLAWVDSTYSAKHASDAPASLRAPYHSNLTLYNTPAQPQSERRRAYSAMLAFTKRFGRKALLSLVVYLATFIPYIGRFVLPAASFYTFNAAVGTPAAVVIFSSALILPKRYLVMFLQSYFSSRSLMRDLLEPYFSRIKYTSAQKKLWFHDRAGVLYGFALAFFVVVRVPLVGVLAYGIAEASTAYLITKITEPPPPPGPEAEEFKKNDVRWENRQKFLSLPLDGLDRIERRGSKEEKAKQEAAVKGRQFT